MMLATLRCDSLHPEAPVLYGSGTGGRMTRVGQTGRAAAGVAAHLLDRSAEPGDGAVREQLVTRLLPVLAKKPQGEFNVFDVMRYGGHERQLSDVFAWLLDADGTHKLGDAFLRIFIDEVNRGIGGAEPVAHGAYGVRQEVNTAEAGAGGDIADLIVEGDKTVLVVENYYTSSGHGHSYHGYLSFGERGGKRGV